MKIGILYIVTGRYRVFWPLFYSSAMEHFFPGETKHFYIFTDSEPDFFTSHGEDASLLTITPHQQQPWPYTTLLRYRTFTDHQDIWKDCDYIFFINADYEFYRDIGKEILPTEQENHIVLAEHQKSLDLPPDEYPYERNEASTAYIPFGKGEHYVAGGFIGGTAESFLTLSRAINDATNADLEKGIIAVWHDESQLNAYVLDKQVRILPPWYIWPSYNTNRRNRHLVIAGPRDKNLYGGHDWLRGATDKKKKTKFRRRLERHLMIIALILAAAAAFYVCCMPHI